MSQCLKTYSTLKDTYWIPSMCIGFLSHSQYFGELRSLFGLKNNRGRLVKNVYSLWRLIYDDLNATVVWWSSISRPLVEQSLNIHSSYHINESLAQSIWGFKLSKSRNLKNLTWFCTRLRSKPPFENFITFTSSLMSRSSSQFGQAIVQVVLRSLNLGDHYSKHFISNIIYNFQINDIVSE